ncbi:MAG: hypothetical protein WCG36_03150 [bacterium]
MKFTIHLFQGRSLAGQVALACMLLAPTGAFGTDANGNEFALSLAEAKTPQVRTQVLDGALGRAHFFRYLRVMSCREGETNGYPFVDLTTLEPSSGMTVGFTVVKSMSLAVLKEDPATRVGDALAVTGKVGSADPVKRLIRLDPVIVRYKDRLAPKDGQELVSERQSSGIVYSFTGGKVAVNVSKRDEDLLKYETQILAERGKEGWAQFLVDEIGKRDSAEKTRRDKLGIYRQEKTPAAGDGAARPVQTVITGDED